MSHIVVVGSGPSGVHLSASLLRNGHRVTMLDFGNRAGPTQSPGDSFSDLKDTLKDSVDYFLGKDGQSIVLPERDASYYSFPSSKNYVFAHPKQFDTVLTNFEPLISFAAGGLAEAWTGGSYPFNEAELAEFPLSPAELRPYYKEVVRRIGVSAERDDLSEFSEWFHDYSSALRVDPLSNDILSCYGEKRADLNRSLGFYLGRSRVAVLSKDLSNRKACSGLGRCLWGCPTNSLYRPSLTLDDLLKQDGFSYLPGSFVTHFTYEDQTLQGIVSVDRDGSSRKHTADSYVLAAGTLCTSKVFLDSIFRKTGEIKRLTGLMDNPQIMMPFVRVKSTGRAVQTSSYQYHQLALGIKTANPEEYIHGQLTALKAASIHPILQNLPVSLTSAIKVFNFIHSGLGAVNLWLHDRRLDENFVTIEPVGDSVRTKLKISYRPKSEELLTQAINSVYGGLRQLGCIAPAAMTKRLAPGSSVHYAGTIPMGVSDTEFSCEKSGQSKDFKNLFIADGATFPFLPAKNLTFTLMANAARIGDQMFPEVHS